MKTVRIIFILVVSFLAGCSSNNIDPSGSGLIEATEVIVSAETAGRLLQLNFDEGDAVLAGDTLAVIDTVTTQLKLNQALANRTTALSRIEGARLQIELAQVSFDLAAKEMTRAKQLIKSGSMGQQQFDQIKSQYDKARLSQETARVALSSAQADLAALDATIDLLEKQLQDCYPLAPSGGTILTTYMENGELVTLGKALVKIARLDTVWVKLYVPAGDLTRLKLGQRTVINTEDDQGTTLDGRITWIASEAEFTPKNVQTKEARADLVYAVKITIPNENQTLKVGMPVAIDIPLDK